MIVFDLKCDNDHVFEIWFRDSKSFEKQSKKGEVLCPVCGDNRIEKALMAPNISSSKKKDAEMASARAKESRQLLRRLRSQVEEHCDYVGPEFAEEARKIHYGEAEKRDIYGEASESDAQELTEEGVEFARIPWLPSAEN